jgi:hypothetical protein
VGNLFGCYVSITAPGQVAVTQYGRLEVAYLGQDLTGEGDPDVVVFSTPLVSLSTGNTYVFNLGQEATRVMASPSVNCRGEFQDIEGDGMYEYITCDASVAHRHCAGIVANAAGVRVILRFDEHRRTYLPASQEFQSWYEDEIARTEAIAAAATPNGLGEGDGTTKCQVLPLVLTYLYLGDDDAAWSALREYYHYPDLASFQSSIIEAAETSPLFSLER